MQVTLGDRRLPLGTVRLATCVYEPGEKKNNVSVMCKEDRYTPALTLKKKKDARKSPPEQFLLRAVIHCLFSTSEKAVTKAATRVNHCLAEDLLVTTTESTNQRLQAFFYESSY